VGLGQSKIWTILVNDYCGHPFQVELSRALARRGHRVLHVYFAEDLSPKGDLHKSASDPDSLAIESLSIGEPLQKYNLRRRRVQEKKYGQLVCDRIARFSPDIVIASNNPLEAQNAIGNHCRRRSIAFVYWLQDIHSTAIRSILVERLPCAGRLIAAWYEHIEKSLLRNADHVVAISDDFLGKLTGWGVGADSVSVVENWAPKEKIHSYPKANEWAITNSLSDKTVALYSGTLGFKHNPSLLLSLAERFLSMKHVRVVVVSEGKNAHFLTQQAALRGLGNLIVLPYQPFSVYSQVLATADVLVAMIELDAASYSVPSKVLSYLCSGRPIVLAADPRNLASRLVARSRAGAVVQPGDTEGFLNAVADFLQDSVARQQAGKWAREYAELEFNIDSITDRFEDVLFKATLVRESRRSS
jgi:colanic acid biosynthesis glycosyl transferase WcaI